MIPRPTRSTLFPYTTLFRSSRSDVRRSAALRDHVELKRFCAAKAPGQGTATNLRVASLPCRACTRGAVVVDANVDVIDRKSTRLNSSHANISYAVFCLKKKK